MEISNGFLHIQDVKQVDGGKLALTGKFVVDFEDVINESGEQSGNPPKLNLNPELMEVIKVTNAKYILPPKDKWAGTPLARNEVYKNIKAAAEAAGFETGGHFDL